MVESIAFKTTDLFVWRLTLAFTLLGSIRDQEEVEEEKEEDQKNNEQLSKTSKYNANLVIPPLFKHEFITNLKGILYLYENVNCMVDVSNLIKIISDYIFQDGGEWNELIEFLNNAYMIEGNSVRDHILMVVNDMNRRWRNKIDMRSVIMNVLEHQNHRTRYHFLATLEFQLYLPLVRDILSTLEAKYRQDSEFSHDPAKLRQVFGNCLSISTMTILFNDVSILGSTHSETLFSLMEMNIKSPHFCDYQEIFKCYTTLIKYLLDTDQFNHKYVSVLKKILDIIKKIDNTIFMNQTKLEAMSIFSTIVLLGHKRMVRKEFSHFMIYLKEEMPVPPPMLIKSFTEKFDIFIKGLGAKHFAIYLPFIFRIMVDDSNQNNVFGLIVGCAVKN
ncbi:hypothetical protein DFA_08230 [Cavenderia fasciculata]|uniref:Uncharacterized protein n=1 Tax=Cavenderia fasciculata TaxID=261658 RepID=F4Q5I1_CACFS|nr:uncharacterized protein DFA_08230 [Cavenderia fasciculata]EGG17240.1 hypothetical protein DFA_08230 [Cavenderia fasciculata]|eukprot:XP_004355724.1 hypothetical protein DFA_08230 [Cavenderia fasciculata]